MYGPGIVVRTMSDPTIEDDFGNRWQYHSRSDHHSKAACWGILFDLLQHSRLFAEHARSGEIVFGINHRMVDFKNNRKKNLDLVVATPGHGASKKRRAHTFASLVDEFEIKLTGEEKEILDTLPAFREGPVGAVRIALEAKACMTAHGKALPRLYDELNSSHMTVHGASDIAIAAGFVMVNLANTFISSDMNKHDMTKLEARVSDHKQPVACLRAIDKVLEIPRRTEMGTTGFDAIALVVVECRNDGTPVTLVERAPSPPPGTVLHYDSMIVRTAQLYDFKFGRA